MLTKKHLQCAGDKEEKMYENVLRAAKKVKRYGKRAKEIAANSVRKYQRAKKHVKDE